MKYTSVESGMPRGTVAPVRERGLKLILVCVLVPAMCRSRKGAWIEIPIILAILLIAYGRSRKGAWIEIHGLKTTFDSGYVAPVRERGLKCNLTDEQRYQYRRSRKGAWIEIGKIGF